MIKLIPFFLVLVLVGCMAPVQQVERAEPPAEAAGACAFPLLNALASSQDPTIATNQVRLDAIARQFDAAHLGMSTPDWLVPGTGLTVHQYLERANPDLTRWVYIPGGFFYPLGLFDCRNHTSVCAASLMIKDGDWMRKPDGSYVTVGSGRFLNPLTGIQGKLGAYWGAWLETTDLDGIHWDLNETTMNREGGHVDLNLNGISDRNEFGLRWLDAQYVAGHIQRLERARTTGLHVGNGAWQPGQEAYYGVLDGIFVELGMPWRDPADGIWKPVRSDMLRWQLDLVKQWRAAKPNDTIMWIASTYLLSDAYWKQYWNDHADAVRVALALALLTDGELVLEAKTMPNWCDECGVRGGFTSTAAGSGDWLGCPTTPTTCSGNMCWREYQNGAVMLNLGASDLNITGMSSGFRTIRGWYDTATNHGGAWDGVLPGHNARMLWRTTPVPVPTSTPISTATPTRTAVPTRTPLPTATPSPTSSPTPSPVPSPTPTLSVDQRLDKIDQQILDILQRLDLLEGEQ